LALLPSYIVPVCPITDGGRVPWGAGDGFAPCARPEMGAAMRIIVAIAMGLIMQCTPLAARAPALAGAAPGAYC